MLVTGVPECCEVAWRAWHMDALYVGAFIEEVDMHDIEVAIDITSHEDIISVYEELLKGSRNHRCQPWRANARAGSPQKA